MYTPLLSLSENKSKRQYFLQELKTSLRSKQVNSFEDWCFAAVVFADKQVNSAKLLQLEVLEAAEIFDF